MKYVMILIASFYLSACVQQPVQRTEVVDDRPRLSFNPIELQGGAGEYEVVIDGVSYGAMDQYLEHKNELPIVSGRHTIEVLKDGEIVSSETVVLGENTNRVIRVIDRD